MKLRKILFWMHLTAGVFAGIVVFIMSFTGVALMYQKQMTEWADRSYWPAPVAAGGTAAGGTRLPMEVLIAKTMESKPDANPSAVILYSDPAALAAVTIGTGRNVFVNPYTGAVGGEGSPGIRSFFRVMTDWHRYLGAAGEARPLGKAITGASNLAFLFIVVSGIYLWWPRTWTMQSVRAVTWFKRGVSGKARDFNWHNTFGFWTAIPLFFVVISATVISYPWSSNLVYRLAGVSPPAPAARPPAPAGAPARAAQPAPRTPVNLAGIDRLIPLAEQHVAGWRSMNFRLPASNDSEVTFTIDRGWGGQPQLRTTLVLDRTRGDIVRSQSWGDQNQGQRARTWLRFIHTGEFYGLTGQTVAGVASGAGAMLVITGLSLAVRRLWSWVGRRRREKEPLREAAGLVEKEYT